MNLTTIFKGMIGAKAVTTSNIDDLAVGTTQLADAGVTQAKIGAGVAGKGPAFSAYRNSTSQTVTSGTATKVSLNAEDFDTDNAFDSATNFRFQPSVAGYYLLTGRVAASAASGGSVMNCNLQKNGAFLQYGQGYIPPSGSSSMTVTITALVYLNGSTDYVELWTTVTGSGACTVLAGAGQTFLQGALVRAA